jgi:polysaccharide pyruvyl transferase WcaK-like protein
MQRLELGELTPDLCWKHRRTRLVLNLRSSSEGRAAIARGSSAGDRKERPLRVAFYGELGSGNTGNDGSFEAALNWVRNGIPDAQVFAICSGPDEVMARFGIPAEPREPPWPGFSRFRALDVVTKVRRKIQAPFWLSKRLRDTDWVIVPGAGVLESSWYRPWMMPLALYSLTLSARVNGTRVALINVGIDRPRSPWARWLVARVARKADYLTLRDRNSLSALRALHVDASSEQVYPDLAFGLVSPPEQNPRPRLIGVGLINFFDWRGSNAQRATNRARYEASMILFVEWLLEAGYLVRLLTGDKDDHAYLERILGTLRARHPDLDSNRLVGEPARDLHQLMTQISEVEVVVAPRFHNIVISLKLAKPILALSYAPKALGALDPFGLSSFCHPIDAINLSRLKDQFNELYQRRAEIRNDLRRRVPEVEAQIQAQGEWFVAELARSSPLTQQPRTSKALG